ncbi:hypothetical protein C0W88_09875 [Photobacterium leiognathi subsp. mandapamensis]|uniref:hypothetical protein n=1 Tax=Photobacterium leiognathi TaxID=553611 RepID=UPI000D153CC5|nr:hypothetical protein [Photobacterium leiognathi]PSW65369.1 hypothetical protein C0W88_09875 [Photobacterium leiognathi subsp. mandapamensis]
MKQFKLSKITLLIITALPLIAQAQPVNTSENLSQSDSELTLISSESTDVKTDIHTQKDNSRIYLDEGAIWATRDITKFSPVLNIDLSDEVEVEHNKVTDSLRFNIQTNYSHYIKRWQLAVYRGKDRHLSQPLKVLTGDELSNDFDIEWDGKTETSYQFKAGEQLIFRLKVWDKDGNMDVSTLGVTDLVHADKQVEIDKLDNDDNNEKRSYGRATLMRHNIPTSSGMAKMMGTGLKGVDTVTIGEDEYTVEDGKLYVEKYLPTDAYMFPVKVKYDDGKERDYQLFVRIPDTYYAQAGLVDLYFGKNHVSGNKDVLGVDDQYQGDIYNRGRLAYFGQGKFGDKLQVVAHVDTKESALKDMFKHPFAADDTTVFDILDDDDEMYYGNYGDEANIEKVVNTKGKVYLDVQYDKSSAMWGNFNTGLTGAENADYSRSLYGFKGDYRTRQTTSFGDDRLAVTAFASQADTLSSHDEFLGTGGSLYSTRHGEIVPGSDKVTLVVRNSKTGVVESRKTLQSGRDYTINPFQGRIVLNKPLSQQSQSGGDGVLDSSTNNDLENYLSVDYEYVPNGSEALEQMTTGGRVKGWLTDNIALGSTYVQEQKDNQNYQLSGADLTLKATEGSYLTAEFSHSEGQQTDSNYLSKDGGLSFDKIENTNPSAKRQGDMIQVHAVASLYDLMPDTFGAVGNDIEAWYRDKDLGYSYASQDDNLAQLAYGSKLRLQFGDRTQLTTRFDHLDEQDSSGKTVTDTERVEVEGQYRVTDHLKIAAAGRHVNELNNDDQQSSGDLVGVRADYEFNDDNSVYVKGQKTVNASQSFDQDDSVAVGTEFALNDDWTLSGEYATGDRGDSLQAKVDYQVNDYYSTYASYIQEDYDNENNIVFGQKADLTDTLSFYQENQFVDDNNGKGKVNSFGFDYDVNDDVDAGIAFEKSNLKSTDNGDIERSGISVYTSVDKDNYSLKNKVEYRVDKGDSKVTQFVTTNRYVHHLTDEYTLFGKFNYSKSKDETKNEVVERYTESSVGLAYRPIFNDRLNFLTRYTYLEDYDQTDRSKEQDTNNEKSHIVEGETIYSVNAHVDLGLKGAYKKKSELYKRKDSSDVPVKNEIFLTGVSASYKVMKDWDVTGEYHWKKDRVTDDLEQGALVSVNKHINDNVKIGVGYNFSKFDDDLVHNDDYNAKGVFINLVGKF